MENTLNGEISTKSVYISANIIWISILDLGFIFYTIWDRLNLKTISYFAAVPFKVKKTFRDKL